MPDAPKEAPDEAQTPDGEFARLDALEASLIHARRSIAFADQPAGRLDGPRIGMALSGGGIRSATFCLGLIRGLSRNGLLRSFDYLSTVSGGGFTGGMLGRLISAVGVKRAEKVLADDRSLLLWWLRSNGRYLTPAGARDLGMAFATYFRAWVADHVEFGALCVAIALLVVLPHAFQAWTSALQPAHWEGWKVWWFPAAALWLAFSVPGALIAYWLTPDAPTRVLTRASADAVMRVRGPRIWLPVGVLLSAVMLWRVGTAWSDRGGGIEALRSLQDLFLLAAAGTAMLVGWTLYAVPPTAAPQHARRVAEVRNHLTRLLRAAFVVGLVMVAAGALDWLSWCVMQWLLRKPEGPGSWWSAGGLAATLLLLRTFAEPLQKASQTSDGSRWKDWAPKLLNAAGMLGALAVLFAWLVLLQWVLFEHETTALSFGKAHPIALSAVIAGGLLLWLVVTNAFPELANSTSLHSFYRARLTRAYLSIGNIGIGKRFASMDLQADDATTASARGVTEVVPGDDTSLAGYEPEKWGGPIHLINTCLNQSRDDQSGLFNADRKGMMLSVTARGFEFGRRRVISFASGDTRLGTLGRWIAISGAAATPGAGSYTTSGWAAMMFLLGIRLGYWIPAACQRSAPAPADSALLRAVQALDRWKWRWLPKQTMLRSEFSATFFGLSKPWWYLSDGGHFDNTGVYPLLRRELDFILLADCGADPLFTLADVESLVRKARLDFGAEIEFYTREDAARRFSQAGDCVAVLSPADLLNNYSVRGVLLARIIYAPQDNGTRRTGTLLIVKPNLHNRLEMDVLAYAQRNSMFPQQATSNQFFDESQWESYQRLGQDFGDALKPQWLARLPGWSTHAPEWDGLPLDDAPIDVRAVTPVAPPAWKHSAKAAAVGATLGLSASGTLLLGAWQVADHLRQAQEERVKVAHAVSVEAVDAMAQLDKGEGANSNAISFRAKRLLAIDLDELSNGALKRNLATLRTSIDDTCNAVQGRGDVPHAEPTRCTTQVKKDFCASWIAESNANVRVEPLDASYWSKPVKPGYQSVREVPLCAPAGTAAAPATAPAAPPSLLPPSVPAPGRPSGAPARSAPEIEALSDRQSTVDKACNFTESPQKIRLYTQVYDEPSRVRLEHLLDEVLPPPERGRRMLIENVNATAASSGKPAPRPYRNVTLVVHDRSGEACAAALQHALGELNIPGERPLAVVPLPVRFKASPGVIELWFPPSGAQ